MLKNEPTLVNTFLRYHASLFGAENLFVVDNGSTDLATLRCLLEFEAEGVHVDRSYPTLQDYMRKGKIIGDLVTRLDRDCDFDFFILLDCDEFVVLRSINGYTCEAAAIHQYLDSMKAEDRILKVSLNLANILGTLLQFQKREYSKTIFPRNVFLSTDHGHHIGESRSGKESLPCNIVYVHYHYRPYYEVVWYARQKLITEVSAEVLDNVLKLRSFKGRGWHMVDYLINGSKIYYRQFRNVQDPIMFADLGIKFDELGIQVPFGNFELPTIGGSDREAGQEIWPVFVVVEHAGVNAVTGWAIDTRYPAIPLYLQFLIDGAAVYEGTCKQLRPDVLASGLGSEQVGFSFAPPKHIRDGRRHVLTVWDSEGAPMKMFVGGVERIEVDLFTNGAILADEAPLCFGYVDSFKDGRMHGWVLRAIGMPDGTRLLGRNTVGLLCKGEIVVRVLADVARPDVAQVMRGEAECGFAFDVPERFLTGESRSSWKVVLMPEMHELESGASTVDSTLLP